ncbi:MAG: LysE family translocator [bacterium]|nr:LysE family translocator [bacterium]
MSLFTIALSSFVIALSGALSPGPLLAVTISRTISYGPKEGLFLSLGHSILEFALIILLISGFGYYLKKPAVADTIGIIGGCILILFGIWMLFTREFITFDGQIANTQKFKISSSILRSILSGVAVTLSNPYWLLWWVTIGLTYLSIALPRGVSGILVFFIGHISADFLWYSLVSVFLAMGVKPTQLMVILIIMKFCGLFLLGFGIFLIASFI